MSGDKFFQTLDHYRDTEWTKFALSAPDRVVAALHLGTLPPHSAMKTDFGDGSSALYPAMSSAFVAAQEKEDDWTALVDAGVVDALCKLVINAVPLDLVPVHDYKEAAVRQCYLSFRRCSIRSYSSFIVTDIHAMVQSHVCALCLLLSI